MKDALLALKNHPRHGKGLCLLEADRERTMEEQLNLRHPRSF